MRAFNLIFCEVIVCTVGTRYLEDLFFHNMERTIINTLCDIKVGNTNYKLVTGKWQWNGRHFIVFDLLHASI